MFNLYENIKKLCREKKNVTPSRMLVDLGMSKSILSNLNNGRSESITTDTAEKFANYLGVSVDMVLHGYDSDLKSTATKEQLLNETLVAFFGDHGEVNETDINDVANYIEFIKNRKKAKED